MLTCVTLVLTALRPGLAVSLVIFAASAAFGAYRLGGQHRPRAPVPNERRAQAFGNASTGLIVGQGVMLVAADAAADLVTPAVVIVVAGGLVRWPPWYWKLGPMTRDPGTENG